uniref:Putative ovule protein n=1 Tax=Solanum chacoense TaxID=4108 RepID=A0A0V0H8Q1_SOLCH
MAEHPGINLLVVRFLVDPEVAGGSVTLDMDQTHSPEAQSKDEELLTDLKHKISKNDSIKYEEKLVKDATGTTELIRAYKRCNLFLVGRMSEGQVVLALDKKSDCPELGPLGNLLTCPEFSTTASVLVVQQYQTESSQDSINSLKDGELTEGNSDSD